MSSYSSWSLLTVGAVIFLLLYVLQFIFTKVPYFRLNTEEEYRKWKEDSG